MIQKAGHGDREDNRKSTALIPQISKECKAHREMH